MTQTHADLILVEAECLGVVESSVLPGYNLVGDWMKRLLENYD